MTFDNGLHCHLDKQQFTYSFWLDPSKICFPKKFIPRLVCRCVCKKNQLCAHPLHLDNLTVSKICCCTAFYGAIIFIVISVNEKYKLSKKSKTIKSPIVISQICCGDVRNHCSACLRLPRFLSTCWRTIFNARSQCSVEVMNCRLRCQQLLCICVCMLVCALLQHRACCTFLRKWPKIPGRTGFIRRLAKESDLAEKTGAHDTTNACNMQCICRDKRCIYGVYCIGWFYSKFLIIC